MLNMIMRKLKTPKDLNRANTEFWEKTNSEFTDLVEQYPHDLVEAVSMTSRLISAGHMHDQKFIEDTSLEMQLQKAKDRRAKNNSCLAKKSRKDILQVEIERIVSENPAITQKELLAYLENEKNTGIIHDIDEDNIYFSEGAGRPEKSAPISGLRSRLSRVKMKSKSR